MEEGKMSLLMVYQKEVGGPMIIEKRTLDEILEIKEKYSLEESQYAIIEGSITKNFIKKQKKIINKIDNNHLK